MLKYSKLYINTGNICQDTFITLIKLGENEIKEICHYSKGMTYGVLWQQSNIYALFINS